MLFDVVAVRVFLADAAKRCRGHKQGIHFVLLDGSEKRASVWCAHCKHACVFG